MAIPNSGQQWWPPQQNILGGQPGPPTDAILGGGLAPPRIPWSQNPMVTALGSSLLAGRGTLSGAGQVLGQMAPAAMNAKFGMQEAMQKRQEEARRRAAMGAWIKNQSRIPLSPEDQALLAEFPEMGAALFNSSMKGPGETFRQPTPEELAGWGLKPDDPRAAGIQVSTTTGKRTPPIGGGGVNTTVNNIGPIQPDYELVETPEGGKRMQVIPGSKTDEEQRAAAAQADTKQEHKEVKGGIVLDEVARSLAEVEANPDAATGLAGWAMGGLPIPSPAKRVAGFINTLKANTSVANLQAMREENKTGAALGNASDKDMAKMESLFGDLDQSTDPETFKYNLKRINNTWLDLVFGVGMGPPRMDITAPPPMNQTPASGPGGPPAISPGTVIENESTGQKHTMKPDGTWDPPL